MTSLTTMLLEGRHYTPHFRDGETEPEEAEITYPCSHRQQVVGPEPNPDCETLKLPVLLPPLPLSEKVTVQDMLLLTEKENMVSGGREIIRLEQLDVTWGNTCFGL